MNTKSFDQAQGLVKASYVRQGEQALNGRRKMVTALLSNRRLPAQGWDDGQIELFLQELALMDSNNFVGNVGVGEREGRVYSGLVARRNYRFSHGVGRSGDVAEVQPKAAGSSLLAKLCHALAGDALRIAGLSNARASLVLPMATGMSLALTFSALRAKKPGANFVVWPRMDQKSCFKAIVAAGFTPIVVENLLEGDAVMTDVAGVKVAIERCGAGKVLCVVTTTSCFAPRLPDKVDEIARICGSVGMSHVINNAYGIQCSKTCRLINRAMTVGRVDAVVQSTDKNFMVPVGGAVVCGPDPNFIEEIGKSYAGRASSGPCLDLFITLLGMGQEGWRRLLSDREALVEPFRERLAAVAESNGERLLDSKDNTISFAITLDTLTRKHLPLDTADGGVSFLGSMLFTRCVSGTRVVPRTQKKTVAGVDFVGYGASVENYPHDYLTAACAVGLSSTELDEFCVRLDKAIRKVKGNDGGEKKSLCTAGGNTPRDIPGNAGLKMKSSAPNNGVVGSNAGNDNGAALEPQPDSIGGVVVAGTVHGGRRSSVQRNGGVNGHVGAAPINGHKAVDSNGSVERGNSSTSVGSPLQDNDGSWDDVD